MHSFTFVWLLKIFGSNEDFPPYLYINVHLVHNNADVFIRLWLLDVQISASICIPSCSYMKCAVVGYVRIHCGAFVVWEVSGCYNNILIDKREAMSSHLRIIKDTRVLVGTVMASTPIITFNTHV